MKKKEQQEQEYFPYLGEKGGAVPPFFEEDRKKVVGREGVVCSGAGRAFSSVRRRVLEHGHEERHVDPHGLLRADAGKRGDLPRRQNERIAGCEELARARLSDKISEVLLNCLGKRTHPRSRAEIDHRSNVFLDAHTGRK